MLRRSVWAFIAVSSACSGPRFSSDDCGDGQCAGLSAGGSAGASGSSAGTSAEGGEATGGGPSGGTGALGGAAGSTGGTDTGGTDTGGTDTGGTDAGGSTTGGTDAGGSTTGGTDAGGSTTGGTAGASTPDFPRFHVLDDFSREGPALGSDWIGETDPYTIESQALSCSSDFCPGVFWAEEFGVAQEAFATLVSFSNESREINLVLKAQQSTTCDLLELLYAPPLQRLSVEACWNGDWQSFGFVDIALEPGDQLGGRIGDDGFVDLFRNGVRIGRFDANDFPFIGARGRIGVDGLVASPDDPNVWDDFGGGGD